MNYKFIKVERQDYITIITMDRPEVLNAVNPEMGMELYHAWNDFRDDKNQWCAIVTGSGNRGFSTGSDLKAGAEQRARGEATGVLDISFAGAGLPKGEHIYKPIIAAVNGYAIGGGLELTLACDIRIASENAFFGLSEVRWSRIASGGGLSHLPRNIPRAIAMKMILTGEHIDSQEAYRIGLINEVVPLEKLMPRAIEIARTIFENGPLAVMTSKEAVVRGMDMTLHASLTLEDDLSRLNFDTQDNKEGPQAFAEKRKPRFRGS
jgi:E-phenylitaconyl-CoA hydratase